MRRSRIGRVVLEPTIARRADVDPIADRLSRFVRERLPALMDGALRGYAEDEHERLLEHLELDFGTVEPDKLEAWLEARLAGAVRAALMDRFGLPGPYGVDIRRHGDAWQSGARDMHPLAGETGETAHEVRARRADGHAGSPASAGGRSALPFDAAHRTLAAWFEGRSELSADAIERIFTGALDANSDDVVRLMREQGRHTARRERWVSAMTAPMRQRAVQALRPNDARQVLGDVGHVAARRRAAPVGPMPVEAFDDALWQTVFAYLLADRGGRFNRRTFLAALLAGLAARAGLAYVALIDALLERVGGPSQQIDRDESLREILVGLREDADRKRLRERGRAGANAAPAADPQIRDGGGGLVGTASADDETSADADADAAADAGADADAQALAFFLDHGARPWFAPDDFDPVRAALRLARQTPLRMVMLLRGVDAGERNPRNMRNRIDLRIERLAAALDTRARAEWIMQVAPGAGRRITAVLSALDALIERTSWSSSKRASVRRAMSVATLEAIASAQTGAFDEDQWGERMLTRAADSVRASPHELVDALLLATYGDRPRARKMRAVRARLLGLASMDGRDEAVRAEPSAQGRAHAFGGESSDGAENSAGAGSPLVRAFVSAWPTLVGALRLTPTSFDAAILGALRDRQAPLPSATRLWARMPDALGSVETSASDALLSGLTRLARYHGVPLRRWFAALARSAAWRAGDPHLALVRRWRRELAPSANEREAERSARGDWSAAAPTFIEFFCTGGVSGDEPASWLAVPIEQWLDAALRDDGPKVLGRLRAHSADPGLIRRLSAYLRPSGLARLATALEPASAPISIDLLRAASTMAARLGRPSVEREAHRALVAALLAPSGAHASLESIVSRIVEGLARRIGVDAARVAEGLLHGVPLSHRALREALAEKTSMEQPTARFSGTASTGEPTPPFSGTASPAKSTPSFSATASASESMQPQLAPAHAGESARPIPTNLRPRAAADAGIAAGPSAPAERKAPEQRARIHRSAPAPRAIVAAYLRYGQRLSETSLQAALAELADTAPAELRRLIARAIAGEPGRTRLASLAGDAFAIVAAVWMPSRAQAAAALAAAATTFERASAEAMRVRAQALWLRYAMSGEATPMLSALIEPTLARPSGLREETGSGSARAADVSARRVLARWRYAIRSAAADAALERAWLDWVSARESIAEGTPQHSSARVRVEPAHAWQNHSTDSVANDARRASDQRASPHPREAPLSPVSPEAPTEPIRVENAGIVMLWPFLSRYFELLGLLRAGRFVDFDAQSRAVHLLHVLASNEIARHEAQLPLAKVMCGIVPAVPLAPGADRPRDAREIELSEGLLNGVKQNWDKLRGTSVEGLREAFLMRAGRMRREDVAESSWRLDVETKAYDVLLDTLPWNLSIVRLGWMTDLLTVHWRRRA